MTDWWKQLSDEELSREMSRRRKGKKWTDKSKHRGFQNRSKDERRQAAYRALEKRYNKPRGYYETEDSDS